MTSQLDTTGQQILNLKCYQVSKPEMELHMINRKYDIFMQRQLVQNFTYIMEWGQGTCTLKKHTWCWTYSALRHFLDEKRNKRNVTNAQSHILRQHAAWKNSYDNYKKVTTLLVDSIQNLGINKIPIPRPIFVWVPGLLAWYFHLIKIILHEKIQPCLAPFGPIWPGFARFGPVWSCLALFGPVWPRLANVALFGPVWPRLVTLGLFGQGVFVFLRDQF